MCINGKLLGLLVIASHSLLKCHGRRAAAPSSATSGLTSQLEHPAATTYAASQRLCSHDRRAQGLRTYATANEAGRSLRPYLQGKFVSPINKTVKFSDPSVAFFSVCICHFILIRVRLSLSSLSISVCAVFESPSHLFVSVLISSLCLCPCPIVSTSVSVSVRRPSLRLYLCPSVLLLIKVI